MSRQRGGGIGRVAADRLLQGVQDATARALREILGVLYVPLGVPRDESSDTAPEAEFGRLSLVPASTTIRLPLASKPRIGELVVLQCSSTTVADTITVQPAAEDTINGSSGNLTLRGASRAACFVVEAESKWREVLNVLPALRRTVDTDSSTQITSTSTWETLCSISVTTLIANEVVHLAAHTTGEFDTGAADLDVRIYDATSAATLATGSHGSTTTGAHSKGTIALPVPVVFATAGTYTIQLAAQTDTPNITMTNSSLAATQVANI